MSKININRIGVIIAILIMPCYLQANSNRYESADYFFSQPTEQTKEERKARKQERKIERQERKIEKQAKREVKKQDTENLQENKKKVEVRSSPTNTSNANVSPKQTKTTNPPANSRTNSEGMTFTPIKSKHPIPSAAQVIPHTFKETASTQEREKTPIEKLLASKSFWIGGIILFILLSSLASGYGSRCSHCKKWWAMKKIGKTLINEKASWVKKEFKVKNSRGEVIQTHEGAVPATIYTYRIDRRCKHCGHQDYIIKEKKREN